MYGSEVWDICEKNKSKLLAMEMDCWRRNCRVTRLYRMRKEEIQRQMKAERRIVDETERKQLMIMFGHVNRTEKSRWRNRVVTWIPPRNKKIGR